MADTVGGGLYSRRRFRLGVSRRSPATLLVIPLDMLSYSGVYHVESTNDQRKHTRHTQFIALPFEVPLLMKMLYVFFSSRRVGEQMLACHEERTDLDDPTGTLDLYRKLCVGGDRGTTISSNMTASKSEVSLESL